MRTLTADDHPAEDDNFPAKRMKSFIEQELRNADPPLIQQPPKHPAATNHPVLPLRSKRLAAQSLSSVSASQRGEVLIMKHMGMAKRLSTPSTLAKKAYKELFDAWLSASNVEARKNSSRLGD
jgi:hypothetical protein